MLRFLRADAAFALPDLYKTLEAAGYFYAIRLPANAVLQECIAHRLKRPVGRPPKHFRRLYEDFDYQAKSWDKPRRVVARIEWHPGELFPRVGFVVTNLPMEPRHDLGGNTKPSSHLLGHGGAGTGVQTAQVQQCDIGQTNPGGSKFRPVGDDDQQRQVGDLLRDEFHQLQRGRIDPMGILEHEEYRPLCREGRSWFEVDGGKGKPPGG